MDEFVMSGNVIKHRNEIIYFFESNYNNPNGSSIHSNRPRVDETTGECIISPYRIKRTIRDYLRIQEKELILINDYDQIPDEYFSLGIERIDKKSTINTPEDLIKILCNTFIDVRLFGIVMPFTGKNKSIELYGPVQFSYARSIFPVIMHKNQGTAAYASKSGSRQRSFRTEFIIPYALFSLYGCINENTATYTNLTEIDCLKLQKAIWNGTNSLHSRTKIGHKSRLFMQIEYVKKNYQMNLIKTRITANNKVPIGHLRSINQIEFNIDDFISLIKKNQDKIAKIYLFEEDLLIKGYENMTTAFEENGLTYQLVQV